MSRLGLRARLALALVAVALLAVGLATLLSNLGLGSRLSDAAHLRLQRSAGHVAEVAAAIYTDDRGWTAGGTESLAHLAALDGLRVELVTPSGRIVFPRNARTVAPTRTASVSVSVRVRNRSVGMLVVSPIGGKLLTAEDAHLQHSLDRLHVVAGAIAAAVGLVVALLLAQGLARPLRRIRAAAQEIERGDLRVRVRLGGEPEMRAVGHALNRLAETLEHEEEIRKESVADLAHELRTPVNGLLARIEAAQDGVLPDKKANLAAMHAETLRLVRLLDDLARLSDAERPGLLVEMQPLDLVEVAVGEAAAFAPRFAERQIAFSTELASVWVSGDAGRLGQVTANLLSNALRYTEPGGSVRLRVGRTDEQAVLEVADTGIGIDPEDLKHVFKRFWRGEKSRSRATGGAGIGLAVVRELVRAHNGRVDVESTPGRGSVFRVYLRAITTPGAVQRIARPGVPDIQVPTKVERS